MNGMQVRDEIARQLGLVSIAVIELQALLARKDAEIEALQKRLHDAAADATGPSGATSPPVEMPAD